jgi:hypothetical protein
LYNCDRCGAFFKDGSPYVWQTYHGGEKILEMRFCRECKNKLLKCITDVAYIDNCLHKRSKE